MCHSNPRWSDVLPLVMLGLRSSINHDIKISPAGSVYGMELTLPGEFFADFKMNDINSEWVKQLKDDMKSVKARKVTRHGQTQVYVPKELRESSFVFVRDDAVRASLQPPYKGPFQVVSRSEKTFVINVNGKQKTISVDRLKPAVIVEDGVEYKESEQIISSTPEMHQRTLRSGRTVRFNL